MKLKKIIAQVMIGSTCLMSCASVSAAELEKILTKPQAKAPSVLGLTVLPTSRRDAAPLVHHIPHASLRHEMVLPAGVESKFRRIERGR